MSILLHHFTLKGFLCLEHHQLVMMCIFLTFCELENIYENVSSLLCDRLREEKMKEKQKHQEERLKAALERAVAQPKKKVCALQPQAWRVRA